MSRLTIELPSTFIFQCELTVRATDVNYGGHVGNDAILSLMQEARLIFYRSKGIRSEMNLEGTVGQIIADAAVVYRSESFLGDILEVSIGVGDITKYGFDMFYRLVQKGSGREVAIGKTGIVAFDYQKRKVAPLPESVKKFLAVVS